MIDKVEEEIKKNWKKDAPILVSICCIAYNHAPYIRQCLDGLLMQKTTFPFEAWRSNMRGFPACKLAFV